MDVCVGVSLYLVHIECQCTYSKRGHVCKVGPFDLVLTMSKVSLRGDLALKVVVGIGFRLGLALGLGLGGACWDGGGFRVGTWVIYNVHECPHKDRYTSVCVLTGLDADLLTVLPALARHPSLKHLHLGKNFNIKNRCCTVLPSQQEVSVPS